MKLERPQQEMLSGRRGPGLEAATSLLLDVGEAAGAKRMLGIQSAHVSGVSYLTGGEGLVKFLSGLAEGGARASAYATLNPAGMDLDRWKEMGLEPAFAEKQELIISLYRSLGIQTTCSCTPYEMGNVPRYGAPIAWAESSAIAFANSFFGARTNRESAVTALCSALAGVTPEYGLHLRKERAPNVIVEVSAEPRDSTDFSVIGHHIGEMLQGDPAEFGPIPLLRGLRPRTPHDLKALGASLATFGVPLCHVEGFTPECESCPLRNIRRRVRVTGTDLARWRREHEPSAPPALVAIGCPQASAPEVDRIASLLAGKRLVEGVELWVFTSRAQRAVAEQSGAVTTIEKAGGRVLVDTCPEVVPYPRSHYPSILVDSMKAHHYIRSPGLAGIPASLLPTERCVRVATGEEKL